MIERTVFGKGNVAHTVRPVDGAHTQPALAIALGGSARQGEERTPEGLETPHRNMGEHAPQPRSAGRSVLL